MYFAPLLFKRLLRVSLLALCTGCSDDEPFPILQASYPVSPPMPSQKEEEKPILPPQDKEQEDKPLPPQETPPSEDDVRVAGDILQAHYNETQYMPTREDRIVILMTKMKIDQRKAEDILDAMMLD